MIAISKIWSFWNSPSGAKILSGCAVIQDLRAGWSVLRF